MNHWESIVERKIREASVKGEFDNLAGKGRPVDTSENPFEDPELRMAHRLLQNAGFASAWIEERKDIDAELAVATFPAEACLADLPAGRARRGFRGGLMGAPTG